MRKTERERQGGREGVVKGWRGRKNGKKKGGRQREREKFSRR